jgi:hypothetical protein
MPIKRLYHKLTNDESDATGFDSETLYERRKDADVKGQRLQLIVYTALFAFIVLAAYGYYLIFNLTHDVHSLSNDVNQMTRHVSQMSRDVNINMELIAANMQMMEKSTSTMAKTVAQTMPVMSENTAQMTATIGSVNNRIEAMSTNMQTMSVGIIGMQRDMWSMNQTVSNPAESMIDSIMPWGSRRGTAPGSPGPLYYPPPVR